MTPKTGLGVWCLYVIQSRGQHNLGRAVFRPRLTTYSCLFTQNTVRGRSDPTENAHNTLVPGWAFFSGEPGKVQASLILSGQWGLGKAGRGGGDPVGSGVNRPCSVCVVQHWVGVGRLHYKCSQTESPWSQNLGLHRSQRPYQDEAARPGGV